MVDPNLTETVIGAIAFERVAEALLEEFAPRDSAPHESAQWEPPASVPELEVASVVAAASTLRRTEDGLGDLFSQRLGPTSVALLFGIDPETLLHQRLGTRSAPSAGRDPGAFPTDLERGLLAPVQRPGKGIQVVAGAALAFRMRGESRVGLFVDDVTGTASGDWHEGLNLAVVSRAPVVLVLHTRPGANRPHSALERLRAKAPAYGITATAAPASDPVAVARAVSEAVEAARSGAGTHLVEVEHGPVVDGEGGLATALGMVRSEFEARVVARIEEFGPLAARVREIASSATPPSNSPNPSEAALAAAAGTPLPWYRTEDRVRR